MKYFLDNNNVTWAYDDDVTDEFIADAQVEHGVTFTSLTDAEYVAVMVPDIEDARHVKLSDVEDAFAEVETLPIAVLDKYWNGGYLAGAKYKIAYDLAELAEQIDVGFKDTAGTNHTLSLADAKTVLLAIGADYIAKDTIRDDLIAQVNAATTQAELDAIAISFELN